MVRRRRKGETEVAHMCRGMAVAVATTVQCNNEADGIGFGGNEVKSEGE